MNNKAMQVGTLEQYRAHIEDLEATITDLQNELFRKRAALRIAQKEASKLRYDQREIETLIKALLGVSAVALEVISEHQEASRLLKEALKTSICAAYKSSNLYTRNIEGNSRDV